MARISRRDLDGMFGRAVRAAKAAGIDADGWAFEHGNVTNGISYKIHGRPGRFSMGAYGSHIGRNAAEAYAALSSLAVAWEMVADRERDQDPEPARLTPEDIPTTFAVRPLRDGDAARERATDGACGLSWDDGIVTMYTPAPSARCPFEHFHRYV